MIRVIATAVPRPRIDPRLVASLVAVYVIWSSTYLAIRIAVQDMPPLWAASMRFLSAGSVLMVLALRRGASWPAAREWLAMVPVGALLFVGGNGFVALAEQTVPSGGAAVVCATMPLWVGVLGVVTGERPSTREWASLVLGFAGVLVLMRGPALTGKPEHIGLVILSPVMWATGSLLARRTKDIGGEHASLVGPAMQMLTGGALLLIASAAHGEPVPVHASTTSWLALGYLFVFGSLVGFTAYAWLLRHARPVVATSYAYVNPVLAVLIGAALYGESLGWTTVVANAMIVGAVMLALRKR